MRILLVEDTEDVGEAIVARFERIGHTVDWEKDGGVANEVLLVQAYDLLILDVNLPALDGFTILKRLRQRKTKTPVLVETRSIIALFLLYSSYQRLYQLNHATHSALLTVIFFAASS